MQVKGQEDELQGRHGSGSVEDFAPVGLPLRWAARSAEDDDAPTGCLFVF